MQKGEAEDTGESSVTQWITVSLRRRRLGSSTHMEERAFDKRRSTSLAVAKGREKGAKAGKTVRFGGEHISGLTCV